jgi:hypothetical protein
MYCAEFVLISYLLGVIHQKDFPGRPGVFVASINNYKALTVKPDAEQIYNLLAAFILFCQP